MNEAGVRVRLTGRELVHDFVVVVLRSVVATAVLLALYYRLPVRASTPALQALWLVTELVLFAVLVGLLLYRIINSRRPGLRAVSAFAIIIPVFLIIFARTYLQVSEAAPQTFSTTLDRSTALYFTVTVFTTTGFGDITATADGTRLLVTVQMVLDLIVLATTAKLLVGAATRGVRRPGEN